MSYMCACGRSSSCLCELHTPPAPGEPGDTDRATAAEVTDDDREQALNLAVVLGIHEQSTAMECLVDTLARLRDESYADGYGSGYAAAREQGRAEGRQELAERMDDLSNTIDAEAYGRFEPGVADVMWTCADRIRAAMEAK